MFAWVQRFRAAQDAARLKQEAAEKQARYQRARQAWASDQLDRSRVVMRERLAGLGVEPPATSTLTELGRLLEQALWLAQQAQRATLEQAEAMARQQEQADLLTRAVELGVTTGTFHPPGRPARAEPPPMAQPDPALVPGWARLREQAQAVPAEVVPDPAPTSPPVVAAWPFGPRVHP